MKLAKLNSIQKPAVWVPLLAAMLTVIGGFIVDRTVASLDSDPTLEMEQQQILAILELERGEERQRRLCDFHYSNLFQSKRIAETIAERVAEDPRCSPDGYANPQTPSAALRGALAECQAAGSPVTASCTAYDKSGFHSRPGDTCPLHLAAGDGRFFAQEHVTVLSESYRQLSGQSALDAVLPLPPQDGLIRAFSGRIGCTNDRGTGRTCSATATVRAISYPESHCRDVADGLRQSHTPT